MFFKAIMVYGLGNMLCNSNFGVAPPGESWALVRPCLGLIILWPRSFQKLYSFSIFSDYSFCLTIAIPMLDLSCTGSSSPAAYAKFPPVFQYFTTFLPRLMTSLSLVYNNNNNISSIIYPENRTWLQTIVISQLFLFSTGYLRNNSLEIIWIFFHL